MDNLGRSISEVARLGFDHGWLFLSPRFLNLGRPVLLVDFRLIGADPASLGLEPFGSRDPDTELPLTRIETDLHPDRLIALWSADGPGQRQLLAYNRAATAIPGWTGVARCGELAVLIVGDTHAVQLGWAALWDCHIGITHTASMAFQRSPRSGEPALRLAGQPRGPYDDSRPDFPASARAAQVAWCSRERPGSGCRAVVAVWDRDRHR